MRVVIIGGGFCGALVAKKLEKNDFIDVVLIDKKSYFEYQPSLHKVISDPSHIHKLKIDYKNSLRNATIIISEVKEVKSDYVEIKEGIIDFDILIVSTGADYPIYLENKENVHVLKNGQEALEISNKIVNANDILIVGAGLIGSEIAGEILTKMPEKNLIIVHPYDKILKRIPDDASDYTLKFFEKNGAKLILGEKVVKHIDDIFVTNKNRNIKADLCIWCTGIKCKPDFMIDFPDNCFSEKKALNVNQFLQLEGYDNIFVGGDISSIIEEKTARKAENHAKIIAKNINKILENKQLKSYKLGTSPMVIGLGDWTGIIFFKYVFPGLFVPGILKWFIEWWFLHILK